jgi:uncharacterized protein YjbI with pentapeptide repeats
MPCAGRLGWGNTLNEGREAGQMVVHPYIRAESSIESMRPSLHRLNLVVFAAALWLCISDVSAQTYAGRRAGNVSASGRITNCNYSGSFFTDTKRLLRDLNGGQCVLNGARFRLDDPELMEVYLDNLDLRNSSWVAVDFGYLAPNFRYTIASNADFSAIHMDGEPVSLVDATLLVATKSKFHGAQMTEWFVQGADFSEADFASSTMRTWMCDLQSYRDFEKITAPESERQFKAVGARFYNCLFDEDCKLTGGDFSKSIFDLTKIIGADTEDCLFNGSRFVDAFFTESEFENVNFSGADMGKLASFVGALVDGADFSGLDLSTCNLTNATMKNLVGAAPKLPQDFVIQTSTLEEVVDKDTLRTEVYSIVVSELRYNDGLREKKDQ